MFNLEKMRESTIYNEAVDVDEMVKLEEKYKIRGSVGDQDWLTLLSWENTQLFYTLPCEFNRQTDKVYKDEVWRRFVKDIDVYQSCDKTAKIIHNNGE